jgi:hypothetical protein
MNPLLPFLSATAFVAAYLHVRAPSRRRSGGWLARLILAGGACLLFLYGFYELSVQREFKPENVPIRFDLRLIWPALLGLLVLGALAYVYGLVPPKLASTPDVGLTAPTSSTASLRGPVTPEQANERLAHLLPKSKNEQQN